MPVSGLGVEAWIEVEGERLEEFQEYVDTTEGEPRIVCWVPCKPGKEFILGCSLPPHLIKIANHMMKIHLDGSRIGLSKNSFERDPEEKGDKVRYFTGAVVREKGIIRPFQFGRLELTDEESVDQTYGRSVGEVILAVYSVEAWKALQEDRAKTRPVNDEYRAHERSKKCLNVCVKLGEGQVLKANPLFQAVGQKLLCTFIFKYRPMETLIARGIVPPTLDGNNPETKYSAHPPSSYGRGLQGTKRKASELGEEEKKAEDGIAALDVEGLTDGMPMDKAPTLGKRSVHRDAKKESSREERVFKKRVKGEPEGGVY